MATVAAPAIAGGGRVDHLSGTPRAHAIDRWIYVFTAASFIAIVLTGFIPASLAKIAAVEADSFTVVCADGRFKVSRVQPADGKKIEAGEWAKSANVQAKMRFT